MLESQMTDENTLYFSMPQAPTTARSIHNDQQGGVSLIRKAIMLFSRQSDEYHTRAY